MKYRGLVQAVNDVMAGYDMQLTLRQIYYRLVSAGMIANTRSDYNQLSSQLVTARENGDIDDSRIADRTRRIEDVSFDSPDAFLGYCEAILKQNYLHRFWTSQPVYCEVWVEKDALSQVLANAVYPFNTIVAPSRGYSSYSYLRDAAHRIHRYADGKPTVILHFADHDPSGLDMSRDLQDRLSRFGTSAEVQRIGLTHPQVEHYSLVPNPAKMADTRAAGYVAQYGNQCWELDAIPPDELVRLCRDAVGGLIVDPAAWQAMKEHDSGERERLLGGFAHWLQSDPA